MRPKSSIHLWSIVACDLLTPAELTKNKKFYKEGTLSFKVVFDKRGIVKGDFKSTGDDEDEEDSQEENIVPPEAPLKDLKGDKVWYFNCGTDSKLIGVHPEHWIKNISMKALQANPKFFKESETFKRIMAEHKNRTDSLAKEIRELKQPAKFNK